MKTARQCWFATIAVAAVATILGGTVAGAQNYPTRPIQVILFYITAAVMPADGSIHFAQDIYGHDATLDRALRRRPDRLSPSLEGSR